MNKTPQFQSNGFILIAMVTYIILLTMKNIDIFITPRFWAEEASLYYKDAFNNGFSSIFSAHQGYYSIVPNISTYLATLFPMESAPVITTYISFLIQLIPAYLILKNDSFNYKHKLLLLLSLLFAGFTNEIFTNTITSQFHFIVIAYLLLIGNYRTSLSAPLLLLSALSGPSACFLLPFFLIKAHFVRKRKNIINTFVFLIATLIQLFVVVAAEHVRSVGDTNFIKLILQVVYYSFFHLWHDRDTDVFTTIIGATLTIISIAIYLIKSNINERRETIYYYLLPLIFVTFLSIFTSLANAGGGRYAYATSFMFCCFVIKLINESKKHSITKYALSIIFFFSILISGKSTYQSPEGSVHSPHWKSWKSQVHDFKTGKIDSILIYPQLEHAMWEFKP